MASFALYLMKPFRSFSFSHFHPKGFSERVSIRDVGDDSDVIESIYIDDMFLHRLNSHQPALTSKLNELLRTYLFE